MESVSVVIPAKNGIRTIRKCIDGILAQTIDVEEIVVVDSGSTDGTIEILEQYDEVKLIEIPPKSFDHGDTRNLGVQHASGDYVVLTVQDAWPVNEYWLENMLRGFREDGVVAVCGQQVVPHEPDKNPVQWFRPYTTPEIVTYSFTKEVYEAMSPADKQSVCCWDDVTAMYKRDVLLSLPFRKTPFAEDAWWANDALQAGYTIAYNYNARVFHYHHESKETAFKRNIAEMYSTYRIFKVKPATKGMTIAYYLHILKALLKADSISLADRFKWFRYNVNLQRAAINAASVFNETLQSGETELDHMYVKYCGRA
ncbi:MAG TPA: glycosyltransferase family 2 protein [Flavipsychrobacter sp.]